MVIKFLSFYQFAKTFNSDDFDYDQLNNTDFVFMRWKVSYSVSYAIIDFGLIAASRLFRNTSLFRITQSKISVVLPMLVSITSAFKSQQPRLKATTTTEVQNGWYFIIYRTKNVFFIPVYKEVLYLGVEHQP